MGHRNKKATQNIPTPAPNPPFDINNMGQLLNNVDINSMSNMLSNMDINQVISVLSKAFTPPINTSPGNVPSNTGNSTPNGSSADIPNNSSNNTSNDAPKAEYLNPLKAFNIPDFNPANKSIPSPLSPVLPPNDPTVMILNSLKPFLPSDKCKVIDNMIQVYGIKTVIDKIFPPSAQINSFKEKNNSVENKSEEQPNDKPESI